LSRSCTVSSSAAAIGIIKDARGRKMGGKPSKLRHGMLAINGAKTSDLRVDAELRIVEYSREEECQSHVIETGRDANFD
jgi:hypothetical protein